MLLKKYRIAKVDETVYPGIYPIINKYIVKFSRTRSTSIICSYKCRVGSLCDRLFVGKSRIVHTCFNDPKTSKRKYYYYPYVVEKKRIILPNFWNRLNSKDLCALCKWYSDCNYKAHVWKLCKKANNNGELFTSKYSYAYVVEKI